MSRPVYVEQAARILCGIGDPTIRPCGKCLTYADMLDKSGLLQPVRSTFPKSHVTQQAANLRKVAEYQREGGRFAFAYGLDVATTLSRQEEEELLHLRSDQVRRVE